MTRPIGKFPALHHYGQSQVLYKLEPGMSTFRQQRNTRKEPEFPSRDTTVFAGTIFFPQYHPFYRSIIGRC